MLCLAARELLVIGPVLCLARDCLVDFGLPWGRRDAGGGGLTHPEVIIASPENNCGQEQIKSYGHKTILSCLDLSGV